MRSTMMWLFFLFLCFRIQVTAAAENFTFFTFFLFFFFLFSLFFFSLSWKALLWYKFHFLKKIPSWILSFFFFFSLTAYYNLDSCFMILKEIMAKLWKANAALYGYLFKHALSNGLLSYTKEISPVRVVCVPRPALTRHLDELGIHFLMRFRRIWHLPCVTFWKFSPECMCMVLLLQIRIVLFGAPVGNLGQIS